LEDFEFIHSSGSRTYWIVSKVLNKKTNQIYALKKISVSFKNQNIYETECGNLHSFNNLYIAKLIHSFKTYENNILYLEHIEGTTLPSQLSQFSL
jgi:serine/threonine protein kinase